MGARTSPVETRISPVAKAERVGVLDVLRGFALLGILMVNMASFRGPVFGEAAVAAGGLDRAATFLVAFAFEQKFYVLFSFLFGYGLSVQMFRAAAKGTPFVPRYLRRLLGLFLIGVSHAVLLYTGDILVTYALLGVILLLLRNARDRTLIVVAAALVTLTALMFVAGGILLGAQEGAGFGAGSGIETERSVEAYRGTPAEVVAERVREYPGALGFALLGQGPTALAMFLVGLWAGRRRLFERVEENLPLFGGYSPSDCSSGCLASWCGRLRGPTPASHSTVVSSWPPPWTLPPRRSSRRYTWRPSRCSTRDPPGGCACACWPRSGVLRSATTRSSRWSPP